MHIVHVRSHFCRFLRKLCDNSNQGSCHVRSPEVLAAEIKAAPQAVLEFLFVRQGEYNEGVIRPANKLQLQPSSELSSAAVSVLHHPHAALGAVSSCVLVKLGSIAEFAWNSISDVPFLVSFSGELEFCVCVLCRCGVFHYVLYRFSYILDVRQHYYISVYVSGFFVFLLFLYL